MSRSNVEVMKLWRSDLRPFRDAGYGLFPLKVGESTPRDVGWQTKDYANFDPPAWLVKDGRVGVLLAPDDLIIDIDPRNGGDQSFDRLCADIDNRLDAPSVRSGGRGLHLYFKKPPELRTRVQHKDYPGIDFKRFGGYVVAPVSTHKSGNLYRLITPPPVAAFMAPQALLDMIEKPQAPPRVDDDGGIVSCAQLEELLSVLDPADFGQGGKHHHDWLALGMACHDATDGFGMPEWLEWNARDETYGEQAFELNRLRWESFDVGGGVSFRTLFHHVSKAGRRDLVRSLRPQFDADQALQDFLEVEYE